MQTEFDGLETAGTFADISEIPDIVNSKWLLKSKGDGMA